MLTVDFEFYSTSYHGGKISEAAWPAFARDAAAYVDKVTFGRASDTSEELQMQEAGGVVASASNDGYSETYVAAAQTPSQRMRAAAGLWLDGTGLLFRGACCPC